MKSAWRVGTAGVCLLFGLSALAADPGSAKKPTPGAPQVSAAEQYVREALAAELAGNDSQRDALLAKALAVDPTCKAARWQNGYISIGGKWLSLGEAANKYAADKSLSAYRNRRDQAASSGVFARTTISNSVGVTNGGSAVASGTSVDTYRTGALSAAGIAAEADLARWCRTLHLTDEERAHWTQVLNDDPTSSEAQARLGLHWYEGNLLTTAQIAAIDKQHALEEKQLAAWKPVAIRWRKTLRFGSATEQSATIDEMRAAADLAIIPALQWADANDAKKPSERDAISTFQRESIALLGRLLDERAAYTLVQWSIKSPQAEVRTAAADALKQRPLHDVVPVLLAGLANPLQFDYSMSFDPTLGLAIYRAVVSQEGRASSTRVEYSNSVSGLLPSFVGSRDSGLGHGLTNMPNRGPVIQAASRFDRNKQTLNPGPQSLAEVSGAAAVVRQSEGMANSVDQQNQQIELTNRRIDFVLERIVGKKSSDQPKGTLEEADAIPDAAIVKANIDIPQYWWNWWADYTETYQSPKQISITTIGDSSYTALSQYPSLYRNPRTANAGPAGASVMECFAAGTPVATLTGPVAIEKLQIGDRVLSQDTDTGELAYKPVLAATIRPPVETVLVTTTHGDIRATRGHPFWIVGKGWRMAKEVQIGDRLHSLAGGAVITTIKSLPEQSVYNLSVADYGTYFVGGGQILVHDNTPRLPSRALLPGFVADGR